MNSPSCSVFAFPAVAPVLPKGDRTDKKINGLFCIKEEYPEHIFIFWEEFSFPILPLHLKLCIVGNVPVKLLVDQGW